MSFFHKKIVFIILLSSGVLIALAPFIFAAITKNEDIIRNNIVLYPMVLVGLGLIIASDIFQKRAFICPKCRAVLVEHGGGPSSGFPFWIFGPFGLMIGLIKSFKMKECPYCHEKLD